MPLEAIKTFTIWLATGTEGIAGLVIAVAVIEAAGRTVLLLFRHTAPNQADASHEAKEEVRLRLGRWLALALEFELGADILRTAVAPTWSEIRMSVSERSAAGSIPPHSLNPPPAHSGISGETPSAGRASTTSTWRFSRTLPSPRASGCSSGWSRSMSSTIRSSPASVPRSSRRLLLGESLQRGMSAILWLALAFSFNVNAAPGQACVGCHTEIVEAFRRNGMGRSINERPMPPAGTYYYKASNRYYTVADGRMRRHHRMGACARRRVRDPRPHPWARRAGPR